MKQQVCVGGFIQNNEGKFLVVKRSDTDEFMAGKWELPGGGVDGEETPQKALIREIKEEVGLDIIVGRPLTVNTYSMKTEKSSQESSNNQNGDQISRIEITFLCHALKPFKDNSVTLSFEHSAYQWITQGMTHNFAFSDYMLKVISDSLQDL